MSHVSDHTIFLVNDEPYCLWGYNLRERNLEFLDGLDPDFFSFQLNLYINSDNEKRASLGLAICLHHALETLFTMLGAYVQAPDAVYAWVGKCRTEELKVLVARISEGDPSIFNKLRMEEMSWQGIAEKVFVNSHADPVKCQETASLFGNLWKSLARDFLDETQSSQYNAIKHGFRVRSGGFSVAVGTENAHGSPPSPEDMQVIGHSKYGASFFRINGIGISKKNRSIRSRRTAVNWSIEKITSQIQLAQNSISNIISSLKILNGAKGGQCKFVRPADPEDFLTPWKYSAGIGVLSINVDDVVDERNTLPTTKEQLISIAHNKPDPKPGA